MAQYERKYRGRELPGFINYKTFEGMVREQIKQLEEPAVLKLKEVAGKSYHTMNADALDMYIFQDIFCYCVGHSVSDFVFCFRNC